MVGSPSRFGPYELVSRLGAGGMAETFLAVRRGPGGFEQRVCVKRILPAFERDAAFVHQFLDEARVSAQLRHANIVQVVDFGVADSSHYLALELVEGMDLYRLLDALEERGETMTSGLVVHLANELATALDYAHNLQGHHGTGGGPVVHRDISPSNVLVSRAGEVKLTDFGIAKAVSKSTLLTTTGTVKGKVPYMAPEYALQGRFDARGDLFALGVLLFEALAGQRPFIGATDLDTLQRISEGRRPALSDLCPSAPKALVDAIERLLDPDPDARFQSAAELIDALVDVAPPPTARRILGDLVRRLAETTQAGAPPSQPAAIAYEPTSAMPGERPQWSDRPQPASGHDATRTRAPSDNAPTVRSPTPVPLPFGGTGGAQYTSTAVGPQLAAQLETGAQVEGGAQAQSAEPARPSATPMPVESLRMAPGGELPRRSSLLPIVGGVAAIALVALGAGIAVLLTRPPEPGAASVAAAPPSEPSLPVVAAAPPAVTEDAGVAALDAGVAPVVEVDAGVPERTASTRRPHREGSTRAPSPPPPEPPATPPPATPPPAVSAAPTPPPVERAPGSVNIVVMPFGEVWIDGDYVGSSPVRRQVSAGAHVIEAGPSRAERTMRRTVEIGSGQHRDIVMR